MVALGVDDSQFSEVFVERYEHSLLGMSAGKYCVVTRIIRPIAGPYHVVSRGS